MVCTISYPPATVTVTGANADQFCELAAQALGGFGPRWSVTPGAHGSALVTCRLQGRTLRLTIRQSPHACQFFRRAWHG